MRQRSWRDKIKIKLLRFGRPAAFCSVHRSHTWILFFRQTNPKIEIQRPRKCFAPILGECFPSYPADEFIEKKSNRARVITVRGPGWPQRLLHLQRANHCIVVEHIN